jgi:flagellar hook-length control protein FliK
MVTGGTAFAWFFAMNAIQPTLQLSPADGSQSNAAPQSDSGGLSAAGAQSESGFAVALRDAGPEPSRSPSAPHRAAASGGDQMPASGNSSPGAPVPPARARASAGAVAAAKSASPRAAPRASSAGEVASGADVTGATGASAAAVLVASANQSIAAQNTGAAVSAAAGTGVMSGSIGGGTNAALATGVISGGMGGATTAAAAGGGSGGMAGAAGAGAVMPGGSPAASSGSPTASNIGAVVSNGGPALSGSPTALPGGGSAGSKLNPLDAEVSGSTTTTSTVARAGKPASSAGPRLLSRSDTPTRGASNISADPEATNVDAGTTSAATAPATLGATPAASSPKNSGNADTAPSNGSPPGAAAAQDSFAPTNAPTSAPGGPAAADGATQSGAASLAHPSTVVPAAATPESNHSHGAPDAGSPAAADAALGAGQTGSSSSGVAAAPTFKVDTAVNSPEFGQGVAAQVSMMVDSKSGSAKLEVNPASLGPIEVRIAVQGDHAQVWLTSHSAVTRDALESTTPKLREMLSAQGFSQVSVDISQRSFQERTPRSQPRDGNPAAERKAYAPSGVSSGNVAVRGPSGILDAYA